VHCFEPATENEPASQLAQEPAPVEALKVPALQFRQVVEPTVVWYRPTAQPVHWLAPAAEYVPAIHAMQAEPALKKPALQTSGEHELCPTLTNWPVPAGQAAHEVAPPPAAIVPAGQSAQARAEGDEEYLPARHVIHWVPPDVSLYVPAAQPWQTVAPPAAAIAPGLQLMQSEEPGAEEKRPASQLTHWVPPVVLL